MEMRGLGFNKCSCCLKRLSESVQEAKIGSKAARALCTAAAGAEVVAAHCSEIDSTLGSETSQETHFMALNLSRSPPHHVIYTFGAACCYIPLSRMLDTGMRHK